MELQCSIQNYAWGKVGHDSEVARLATVCNKSLVIDENKPYAELWMGTHVSGPSYMVETDETLAIWLQRNLDSLGPNVRNEFGNDLPFLFKVLSVQKALSIQAHPNKVNFKSKSNFLYSYIESHFTETRRRTSFETSGFI